MKAVRPCIEHSLSEPTDPRNNHPIGSFKYILTIPLARAIRTALGMILPGVTQHRWAHHSPFKHPGSDLIIESVQ